MTIFTVAELRPIYASRVVALARRCSHCICIYVPCHHQRRPLTTRNDGSQGHLHHCRIRANLHSNPTPGTRPLALGPDLRLALPVAQRRHECQGTPPPPPRLTTELEYLPSPWPCTSKVVWEGHRRRRLAWERTELRAEGAKLLRRRAGARRGGSQDPLLEERDGEGYVLCHVRIRRRAIEMNVS